MKALHQLHRYHSTFNNRSLLRLLIGMLLIANSASVLSQYDPGASVDWVCPCKIESTKNEDDRLKASIKNYGNDASGELSLIVTWSLTSGYFTGSRLFPIISTVLPGQTIKIDKLIPWSRYKPDVKQISGIYISLFELKGTILYGKSQLVFSDISEEYISGTTLTSIDYLIDSDKDGVSDYNELLMNTKPNNPTSKPGTVTIDIMVMYPAELDYRHDDLKTWLYHSLEWANMALQNSGIDARFRFAHIKRMEAGKLSPEGHFVDWKYQNEALESIDEEREKVGGDLLMLISFEGPSSASVLSLASLELSTKNARMSSVSTVNVNHSSGTFAHELGHNLGLRHSPKQSKANHGVFRWARGHGIDSDFVTIMPYSYVYLVADQPFPISVQYFSNPRLNLCGRNGNKACGIARDMDEAADAALAIKTVMYKVSQLAPEPPDDDSDGIPNALDAFPDDPAEIVDTDGDQIGDRADTDDDNDGLTDIEESALGTDPKVADSDGDSVIDGLDPFPMDYTSSIDADGDGLDASIDANDNDAGMTWTSACVDLTPDSTLMSNVIATFDNPSAIRKNKEKYELTGVFADAKIKLWDWVETLAGFYDKRIDSCVELAFTLTRVGVAGVNTYSFQYRGLRNGPTGTIKIKGVAIIGDYINFMMEGGNVMSDVGVKLLAAGSTRLLAVWRPRDERCGLHRYAWRHFDVSALTGQIIDIEIFDNDKRAVLACGHNISFDHFYQSDIARGRLEGTASLGDRDGDGVLDGADAFPDDPTETADYDEDGIGDNADLDDDADRVPDDVDAFPRDKNEWIDTDGDGVGDKADAFPSDPAEWLDTDKDSTGNNADLDDDGDGTLDAADAFPFDPSEWLDTDDDGVGDNEDPYPHDPAETADYDYDFLGDNREFELGTNPGNPNTDDDSFFDGIDAFPLNPAEWLDTDEDGVGDNRDVAPNNIDIAYNCPHCKTNQTLQPDAANAAKVIADLDAPLAIQRNSNIHKSSGGKYTLTGVFADPATAVRGWNFFETQDEEARRRQRLGSNN